jgi:hypothetical protein
MKIEDLVLHPHILDRFSAYMPKADKEIVVAIVRWDNDIPTGYDFGDSKYWCLDRNGRVIHGANSRTRLYSELAEWHDIDIDDEDDNDNDYAPV